MDIKPYLKKKVLMKNAVEVLVIIGILATIGTVFYRTGFHNGEINQCDIMGQIKLNEKDGKCMFLEDHQKLIEEADPFSETNLKANSDKFLNNKNDRLDIK